MDWLAFDWTPKTGCVHKGEFETCGEAIRFARPHTFAVDKKKSHQCTGSTEEEEYG